jgi:3-deoxy-7-phosphoheptulonate synthase
MNSNWQKTSWRAFPMKQKTPWPDETACAAVLEKISCLPALVFAGETRLLKAQLAEAARGDAFVLQCGDCAEEFSRCHGPRIHALIKVILQMSTVLSYAGGKRLVNLGRIAGQYAKPRSSDTEVVDGVTLASYRGDMVNGNAPTPEARTPDPQRLLEGYFRSVATLNLIRAFTTGGYASLENIRQWHSDFRSTMAPNSKYAALADEIGRAIRFLKAMGVNPHMPQLDQLTMFASHEALLLEYEEALTRVDTTTGKWYDTSAHFLWIGDRTRQSDGAHIEFASGINNPVGVKLGPSAEVDDVLRLVRKLDPENEPGRLTLITRFGSRDIGRLLPRLLRKIKEEGRAVVWLCDPMHANTYKNSSGRKTRNFDEILTETKSFFEIHKSEGTPAGGVHLELTGDNVTECVGGARALHDDDLSQNYQTTCDPRLNAEQAVELAFEISSLL